jgi:short-subunit dehydrogenase
VITGRDAARTTSVAAEIGRSVRGIGLDLTAPHQIAERLSDITAVDHLVLAAIARDANSVREYDVDRAIELVALKLVGYTETVHTLAGRLHDDSSILPTVTLCSSAPKHVASCRSERHTPAARRRRGGSLDRHGLTSPP